MHNSVHHERDAVHVLRELEDLLENDNLLEESDADSETQDSCYSVGSDASCVDCEEFCAHLPPLNYGTKRSFCDGIALVRTLPLLHVL